MPTKTKLLLGLFIIITLGGIFLIYQTLTTFQKAEIQIEWETASEVDTIGFNILRSENPEGDFTQINAQLIPASSDPLSDNVYRYKDPNVQAGRTYYYLLEDLESSGGTNTHGPIEVKATNQRWMKLALAGMMFFAALLGGLQLTPYQEENVDAGL
ncbi:MAG: hypothetical protein MAG431_01731 [Chloroflexi bacterium]|nr:hypothetical protein [Chloroflexota bacterium]